MPTRHFSESRPPWTHREPWRKNRIEPEENAGSSWWVWGFAGSAITSIMVFTLVAIGLGKADLLDQVSLVSVAALCFAVLFALFAGGRVLYQRRYRQRHGETVFVMDEVPGTLGGTLDGVVQTGVAPDDAPREGFTVQLTCFQRDLDHRARAKMNALWRDEKRVRGRPGKRGVEIPVSFDVPAGAPPSTPQRTRVRVVWRLDVSAERSGIDYAEQMEVPVFAPSHQDDAPAPDDASNPDDVASTTTPAETASEHHDHSPVHRAHEIGGTFTEPVSRGITMEQRPSGGMHLHFGAARIRGLSLLMGGVAVVMAVLVMLVLAELGDHFDAEGLMVLLTSLLGLGGFGYGAYHLLTFTSSVTVEGGEVIVRAGGLLGRSELIRLPCRFLDDAPLSPGQRLKNTDQLVLVFMLPKNEVTAGSGSAQEALDQMSADEYVAATAVAAWWLPDHAEAEWIAERILESAEEQARWGT